MIVETKPLITSYVKCSKLAQEQYTTSHDWVKKVIHWELCKKLKFNYTTKWYTQKPESVLVKEMHKILWDFEMKLDHQILASKPDLEIVNQKKREPAE